MINVCVYSKWEGCGTYAGPDDKVVSKSILFPPFVVNF